MVFAVPPGFVAHASATSKSDLLSVRPVHGGQSAKPTRTWWSFGQQLQGDLRRSTGRGSHCPPIAFPARAGYSSLSQQLHAGVYLCVTGDRNCAGQCSGVFGWLSLVIAHFEGGRVFGLHLAPIVDARGGDMANLSHSWTLAIAGVGAGGPRELLPCIYYSEMAPS
jgi:hypothetical protein